MGLLDHRRTWRYEIKGSRGDCIDAFTRAFQGSGGVFVKANWEVKRTSRGACAIYQGRRGLGAVGGALSRTQALEQDTAVGSEVALEIDESDQGRTACSMWLSSSGAAGIGGLLGFKSDARFIRPYMQAVSKEMLAVDPSALIQTA